MGCACSADAPPPPRDSFDSPAAQDNATVMLGGPTTTSDAASPATTDGLWRTFLDWEQPATVAAWRFDEPRRPTLPAGPWNLHPAANATSVTPQLQLGMTSREFSGETRRNPLVSGAQHQQSYLSEERTSRVNEWLDATSSSRRSYAPRSQSPNVDTLHSAWVTASAGVADPAPRDATTP